MIELKNLYKSYRGKSVLMNISLTIQDNEFFVLIGSSGCGKTTLLKTLNKLNPIDKGEILINGTPINRIKVTQLPRLMGYVVQEGGLFPHMTVEDNIALAMRVAGYPKEKIYDRITELLELVNLEPDQYRSQYPSQLSGGQRQRIAIARALVLKPRLLLLDEPLGALDLKLRQQMQRELKDIQKRSGIAFLYVTHDQEEALTLSDRIAVFNKGFIEQIGTPNEVYNHSQTEFVCNFIGDINRLNDDTVSALRAAGAEVDASKHNYIRLERLHVNVAPRGGEIALDGTVESCEYYGLYIKYYIHVGTQSLKVIEKNDGVNIYDPGQRVKVILNPNDIMAYAPSAEEVE